MSKAESADLILKLYELRREEKMRESRSWMVGFAPESAAEIMQALIEPETSAAIRMVTTYWEMAATFVVHGAIDAEMFAEANSEHVVCFCKIEPYLEEVRGFMNNPNFLTNFEKMIMQMPDAKEMLAARRDLLKRWRQARAARQQ